ncbi:TonB-dependent receptor domain-containing protein [Prevotella conceptionensis]|uniref:TonB-dependent receptor domain-containing protein n=1 Tax=Prevotella conceptionensis TaxID=340486 RepID=UPI0003022CD8|nr:TonB-dependent receptor [Prevotella conceptionensis]
MRIEFYQKSSKAFNLLFTKRIIRFLFILIPWIGNAQAQTYQGGVFDSEGQPLEFANVVVLSLPDSVLIKGTVTNSKGEFTLSLDTPIDSVLFKVSLVGYQTTFTTPAKIGSIVLPTSSVRLAEVVVKGNKKAFSIKGNNLVCNVAGTSLSSESHINDLLGKLPGFYMQGDQLKSINQGEIKYFLNNRPATAEEIARIDVKAIKSVEIDRHPGSRYSGEVGSVVFIHTSTLLEGVSAFLRSYTRINHKFSQGIDGEVRYRYKRISLTLGADNTTYQSQPQQENTFELLHSATLWKVRSQDTKKKNKDSEQMYFANLEYNFTDKHQLNLRYTRQPSRSNVHLLGNLSVWKGNDFLYEGFESNIASHNIKDNINLYYKGVLSKHWTIDLASDWYQQRTTSEQHLQEKMRFTEIYSRGNSSLWGFSPRAVYQARRTKIEVGGDWSKSVIRGWTRLNIADAQPTDNTIQEIKGAGYLGVDCTMPNQRWNMGLGLRFERTNKRYQDHAGKTETESFCYQTLLPSLSLSYAQEGWTHQLSYNSSIIYPTFSQLASGDVYLNRYNIKQSNPSLERSVVHNISYDCSYRWLYLSVGYTYTHRPILETFELNSYHGEHRIKVTSQNLSYMQGFKALVNAAPRFGLYEPRFMLGFIQNFITLPSTKEHSSHLVSKPFVILSLNNSFTFPHQWEVSLDYSHNGAGSSGYIEYSSSSSLNCSVVKHFFERKLRASLKLTDIFDTSTPRISGRFQGVLLNGRAWMDSRSVRLNISWYFNQHRTAKTHSSISSEMNRL